MQVMRYSRRGFIRGLGSPVVAAVLASRARFSRAAESSDASGCRAEATGRSEESEVAMETLAAGGNAVDAAVTGALAAAVTQMVNCGIGGYGGHMVVGLSDGRTTAIDFNSMAPNAARDDMYVATAGEPRQAGNVHGWLAVGVPGVLAGMQLALDRYGTWPLARALGPAIRLAQNGWPVDGGLAAFTSGLAKRPEVDPGFAALLLDRGQPRPPGSIIRNPRLAEMLETLADGNSAEPFYRGEIARRIVRAIAGGGGLVTEEDLAAYEAREVEPVRTAWREHSVATAPLTAGGTTILEILHILSALEWDKRDEADPRTTHLQLEAQRIAWHDRLTLLGDPEQADVPLEKLLSSGHAEEAAARVQSAVEGQRSVPIQSPVRRDAGTFHITASDAEGNLAALTFTHGGGFGARVAVPELGLILGHGMSRFEPRPGHPNSPGPRKRPLHNMSPTVVLRDGKPVLAVGGVGGQNIPNAVLAVLLAYIGRGETVAEAIASPRIQTTGGIDVALDRPWPLHHTDYLRQIGYHVRRGKVGVANAIGLDPGTGKIGSAGR